MRILLVEDNLDLGDAVESKLRSAGHSVQWVHDGVAALRWGLDEAWDALVLDINLPGKDGFSVIRELRAAGLEAPVLVVTARSEIEDKIDMLDLGADDYLVKPFDLRELEARLRALLRRPAGQTSSVTAYGNLSLDLANRHVTLAGAPLELGRREFRLLEILLGKLGQTVAKERLMNQLFDLDDGSLNALELLISRLRKKLAGASVDIVTVRGVGYQARSHEPA
ncbi:response regulator transcription factor [Achromobacter dolens]|uniref:response regulator transcription factor n=1 Tax=Achromobacter dolens TaxID=1287738 RepID=UPI0031D3F22A